ncbi:hypothetical protein BT96DRAFT_1064943 [Gymnopus androsaceus JB14]|uniref:Uncharacterized protein n=1 Tax=Gymnopus androsaceus JB14 TaxID=1447944 RepID=A0A6A4I8D2_9AGAR|nr:hypothetical protein BT96DRAFT_1064943 [Gymnopus androsaceus JB14]
MLTAELESPDITPNPMLNFTGDPSFCDLEEDAWEMLDPMTMKTVDPGILPGPGCAKLDPTRPGTATRPGNPAYPAYPSHTLTPMLNFTGDPSFCDLKEDAWEMLDPMMNHLAGWGASLETIKKRVQARGKEGLDGLVNFLLHFHKMDLIMKAVQSFIPQELPPMHTSDPATIVVKMPINVNQVMSSHYGVRAK